MTDPTTPETTERSGAGLGADAKRAIGMILIGVAVGIVVAGCIPRMERRLSRPHSFLTELIDKKARSPWPFR